MKPGRIFGREPLWSRALLPVTVAVAATMILLTAVEATKSARRLPPQVGYIPADSQLAALTSSLDGLWRNLGHHTARLRDPQPDSFWQEMNESLHEISARCLPLDTVADLVTVGLDPSGGLTLAVGWDGEMLVTLPVGDPDRALGTLAALLRPPVQVALTIPEAPYGAGVQGYLLHLDRLENATLCAVPPGAPLRGGPQLLAEGSDVEIAAGLQRADTELFLAPSGPVPTKMTLSCRAVLDDGTTAACDCTIDGTVPCDEPYFPDGPPDPLQLASGDGSGSPDGIEVWTDEDESLFAGFTQGRMLISTNAELIREAEARRRDRETRFLGDNALAGLVESFQTSTTKGNAAILGLFRGLREPLSGSIAVSITAGPDDIRLSAALPLDTLGLDVLDRLVADAAVPPPPVTAGTPLRVLLNDPAAGGYGTLANRLYAELTRQPQDPRIAASPSPGEFGEPPLGPAVVDGRPDNAATVPPMPDCRPTRDGYATKSLYDLLGNFAPLARGLALLDPIGPLEGYLLDLRDGVPEVVLVQRGMPPERMEGLIRQTRTRMKADRDIDILCRARAALWAADGGLSFPVPAERLLPYLGEEGGALVHLYTVEDEIIDLRPEPEDQEEAPPEQEPEFDGPAYRDGKGRFDIGYIPPPVTDLDIRYRFAGSEAGDIDTAALKSDAFRLAYARLADGAFAFGTDARTLERFLSALASPASGTDSATHDKLLIEGNPEQLVTLGLLFPQDEIRSLFTTGGFDVLDQYRGFRLSVRPSEQFPGLALDAELTRD